MCVFFYLKLLRASLASPSMPHWVPVFSAVPGTVIKDLELLQDHCVFTVKDSQCRLQIQTLTTQEPYQLNTLQVWRITHSHEKIDCFVMISQEGCVVVFFRLVLLDRWHFIWYISSYLLRKLKVFALMFCYADFTALMMYVYTIIHRFGLSMIKKI